jgi:lysophospholipase L1-like esterase
MNKLFSTLLLLSLVLLTTLDNSDAATAANAKRADFAQFDRRARAGERLNVVFFGASLTWGANSSDPLLTSYRADVARKMERKYPDAHFTFWNVAIGGTGSQLGVFRLERDVLRHHPDLVFLDFSANDDIYSDDNETLASYEALVRRLIRDGRCPVVQMIFPFKWNVKDGEMVKMKRRAAHLKIARYYNTAVGDAIALANERVRSGQNTIQQLWPIDGAHPGDVGYAMFADAAWQGYEDGVGQKKICRVPQKMLYADTYMTSTRAHLVNLGAAPTGWTVEWPHRVSAYFDMLMSRWQDQQLVAHRAKEGEPATQRLKLRFQGAMAMLFGESTPSSCHYLVYLDGKLLERQVKDQTLTEFDAVTFARRANGNVHHVQLLATGLDPTIWHTLEIEPLFKDDSEKELRLESLCVAGGTARVERLP